MPDWVVRHEVEQCWHCGINLSQVRAVGVEERQVFEVPAVHLEVTEHQVAIKCYPSCGQQVKGHFPETVSQAVQYGTRLQAQMVYLNNYQLLPLQRTCEILEAVYRQRPSQAADIYCSGGNSRAIRCNCANSAEIMRIMQQMRMMCRFCFNKQSFRDSPRKLLYR